MNKKYIVRLTADERKDLENLLKKGKTQAYRMKHASILLAIDADGPNWADHHAAKAYKCHENTVRNVRQRFVEHGLEIALERKIQQEPSRKRVIDGEKEARLISIACSQPPEGLTPRNDSIGGSFPSIPPDPPDEPDDPDDPPPVPEPGTMILLTSGAFILRKRLFRKH